jgi:hypothetical protein
MKLHLNGSPDSYHSIGGDIITIFSLIEAWLDSKPLHSTADDPANWIVSSFAHCFHRYYNVHRFLDIPTSDLKR